MAYLGGDKHRPQFSLPSSSGDGDPSPRNPKQNLAGIIWNTAFEVNTASHIRTNSDGWTWLMDRMIVQIRGLLLPFGFVFLTWITDTDLLL